LFYLPQDILAVYLVLYVLLPKFLSKFKVLTFIFGLVIIIILLTSVSAFVTYILLPKLNLFVPQITIKEQFSNSVFALISITGMAATIKYIKLNVINQLRTADISMNQMETELKYLRNQINPHFLFNSLNNIDELIFENQEKASKAIFLLSEILRYVLKKSEKKTVPLNKEIEFIKNYLDFIRFSFKDKNFIKCTFEGDLYSKQISPLLFIPIIENAVKYVNRKAKSPGILICFSFSNNYIELKTMNTFTNGIENKNKNGIGLKNLKRRLDLLYPDSYSLLINNLNNEFSVDLKIFEK